MHRLACPTLDPLQPGCIALPNDYLKTTAREIVITAPDPLEPGIIFIPSSQYLDTVEHVLYVLHEIQKQGRLLTREELLLSRSRREVFHKKREAELSTDCPAAYRRGILPSLQSKRTIQFSAVQAAGRDVVVVEERYIVSDAVLVAYGGNPLLLSRCLQEAITCIKQRLKAESMTQEWWKIMRFALHAEIPGFWDYQTSEEPSNPLFTIAV